MLKEFKIPENTIDQLIKKQLFIAIPVLAISVGFGTFMAFYVTGRELSLSYLVPVCIFIIGIASFALYRAFNKQKTELKSYRLTINDERIIRIQKNLPAIQLNKNDITSVQKNSKGELIIKGANNEVIQVPPQIEDMNSLENYLGADNIIAYKPDSAANKMYFLFGGMVVATFIILRVNNKLVVGLTAAIMFALLSWVIIELRKDKAAFAAYKKALLWLGFVLLLVIFRVVMVFFM